MDRLDLYYSAFLAYRQFTEKNSECSSFRQGVLAGTLTPDLISSSQFVCQVDSDWVEAIERGLPFLGKALKEERQFIRREGDVVPIEKARSVSRDSVEHLAKHSNLLKRAPEHPGDPLIPESILYVEKLSDYAVYENRFLYALLRYLEAFIQLRYDQIQDLSNKYTSLTKFHQDAVVGKRHLVFNLDFEETSRDDPYTSKERSTVSLSERIEALQHGVAQLLGTALMKEVAKAPLVQAPITKTNVLKKDPNFQACLALWDFLNAYTKLGYSVKEIQQRISPFPPKIADEFAELIALTSFMTYKDAKGLDAALKARYLAEQAKAAEAKEKALLAQCRALRERLLAEKMSLEEYLGIIDERLAALQKEVDLKNQALELSKSEHEQALEALKKEHELEISSLLESQNAALKKLADSFEKKIALIQAEASAKIAEADKRIADLQASLALQEQALMLAQENFAKEKAELLAKAQQEEAALKSQVKGLSQQVADFSEANQDAHLRILGLEVRLGIRNKDDTSSETSFDELEAEKKAFDAYFAKAWKQAKASIRQGAMASFRAEIKAKKK